MCVWGPGVWHNQLARATSPRCEGDTNDMRNILVLIITRDPNIVLTSDVLFNHSIISHWKYYGWMYSRNQYRSFRLCCHFCDRDNSNCFHGDYEINCSATFQKYVLFLIQYSGPPQRLRVYPYTENTVMKSSHQGYWTPYFLVSLNKLSHVHDFVK